VVGGGGGGSSGGGGGAVATVVVVVVSGVGSGHVHGTGCVNVSTTFIPGGGSPGPFKVSRMRVFPVESTHMSDVAR